MALVGNPGLWSATYIMVSVAIWLMGRPQKSSPSQHDGFAQARRGGDELFISNFVPWCLNSD